MNRRAVHDRHSLRRGVRWLAILAALVTQSPIKAETLKSETLAAWEAYLETAHSRMHARLEPGQRFLSIDETDARAEKIRGGEPAVFPLGHTPQRVSSGLIHDWVGIAFIPKAKIGDVLATVRNYERYSEMYRPAVVESKASESDESVDRFSMLLANRSVVSKTALQGDYEASYVRIDDHRWYSVSKATRIREIEKYATSRQRMLPENEGSGLIWRLFSITLFEERDGGVYIELEAIALSRDIPFSLRLIATPIVRRVSRNSLLTSLQQTTDAVCSRSLLAVQHSADDRSIDRTPTRSATGNTINSFH